MYFKKIYNNSESYFSNKAHIAKLFLLATFFSFQYIYVNAQASCVPDNSFSVTASAPNIGSNGGDFTITTSDIDNGSIGVPVGVSFNSTSFNGTSVTGNCSNFFPSSEVEVWLFVNNGGTQTSCSTIVDINDIYAPVIECFTNNVISLDPTTGDVTVTPQMLGQVWENCDLSSFSIVGGNPTYDCTNIGLQSVTLMATDDAGLTSSIACGFTIADDIAPTASCMPLTVSLSNGSSISASDLDDDSEDNCGGVAFSASQTSFSCNDVGNIINVTLTVTDNSGNTDQCVSQVSVVDDVAPSLGFFSSPTVFLDDMGNHTMEGADVANGFITNDNCTFFSDLIWTFDPPTVNCDSIGIPVDFDVTVTDESQNSMMGMVTVTVLDNNAPEAICYTQVVDLILDANGDAFLTPMMIDSASTDNCDSLSMFVSPSNFNCSNEGDTLTVTFTVFDHSGNTIDNSDICTAEVTIIDNMPPTVVCKLDTVDVGTTIVPGDVTTMLNDNCAVNVATLSQSTFDCTDVGDNVITLTVSDMRGNSTVCTTTVTVEDNVPPTVMAQNIIVFVDANGVATINPFDANNGSTDLCDNSLNFSVSPPTFDCDDLGINTASLIVTDDSGNSASATFAVTVRDTLPPTATTQTLTRSIDASGTIRVGAEEFLVMADDNCMVMDTMISRTEFGGYVDSLDFTCLDAFNSPIDVWVRIRHSNANGNPRRAIRDSTSITLQAATMPVAMANDLTIELDANGEATIDHTDIDNGSSGLCGVFVALSKTEFDCDDVGTEAITLTATDAFGNSATATSMITVEDNEDPILTVNQFNANFDTNGNYNLTISDMATFTDNCPNNATIVADQTSFTCADAGSTLINFTVTDEAGNSAIGSASLNLTDNELPAFACKSEVSVDLIPNPNGMGGLGTFGESVVNEFMHDIDFLLQPNLPFDTSLLPNPVDVIAPTLPTNSSIIGANLIFCTTTDNDAFNERIDFEYMHPTTGNTQTTSVWGTQQCDEVCVTLTIPTAELSSVSGSMIGNLTATTGGGGIQNQCVENNIRVVYEVEYIDNDDFFDVAPTDNCGSGGDLVVSFSQQNFTCGNLNQMPPPSINITVTDPTGNAASCVADVIVQNPPLAVAVEASQIPIQMLDSNGEYSLSTALIDAGSDVSCGFSTLTVSPSTFDCSNLGINIITLRIDLPDGSFDEATTAITLVTDPQFPNPCDPCPDVVTVDNIPVINGIYIADVELYSSGQLSGASGSDNVTFYAGDKVTLQSGFQVNANANLTVNIQECID